MGEVKRLADGYTAGKWQSWASHPGLFYFRDHSPHPSPPPSHTKYRLFHTQLLQSWLLIDEGDDIGRVLVYYSGLI